MWRGLLGIIRKVKLLLRSFTFLFHTYSKCVHSYVVFIHSLILMCFPLHGSHLNVFFKKPTMCLMIQWALNMNLFDCLGTTRCAKRSEFFPGRGAQRCCSLLQELMDRLLSSLSWAVFKANRKSAGCAVFAICLCTLQPCRAAAWGMRRMKFASAAGDTGRLLKRATWKQRAVAAAE